MPYIFISAVALCANLYRCAPLIVGDKYSDPEIMKFLGAKITTDYPEPNSPPMYVMFATMRSVLDALQELGYELKTAQVVQGYYTWIMSKPLEVDRRTLQNGSATGNSDANGREDGSTNKREGRRLENEDTDNKIPIRGEESSTSTQVYDEEPEVGNNPTMRRERHRVRKKDVAVGTDERGTGACYEKMSRTESDIDKREYSQTRYQRPLKSGNEVAKTEPYLTRASQRSLKAEGDISKPESSLSRSYQKLKADSYLSGPKKSPSRTDFSKPESLQIRSIQKLMASDSEPESSKTGQQKLVKTGSDTAKPESSLIGLQRAVKTSSDTAVADSSKTGQQGSIKQDEEDSHSLSKTQTKHANVQQPQAGGRRTSTPVKDNFKK